MLRVEAEKAEEEGRDESWQAVGEHALASLAIVRAYRERALHAAYSGTLPQLSPRRLPGMPLALATWHARSSPLVTMATGQGCDAVPLSGSTNLTFYSDQAKPWLDAVGAGAPEEPIDSEERQMLDALAPSRLRARPSSAGKPINMRTDLEVLQALHTLGYEPLLWAGVHVTCLCCLCTSSTSGVQGAPHAQHHFDRPVMRMGHAPAGTSAPGCLPAPRQHSQPAQCRCLQTHVPRPLPSQQSQRARPRRGAPATWRQLLSQQGRAPRSVPRTWPLAPGATAASARCQAAVVRERQTGVAACAAPSSSRAQGLTAAARTP